MDNWVFVLAHYSTHISDVPGNIVAKYTYDAWGKLVSITDSEGNNVTENPEHIGFINPIRYIGYYYDSETGLYYLNARYYDPETCRFLNADGIFDSGLNLFAYCNNNPTIFFDPTGHMFCPQPLKGKTIVIDPGHGGRDNGSTAWYMFKLHHEKNANLAIAMELKFLLKLDGAKVYLTRDSDRFVSLDDRYNFANNVGADLFVSIHHNSNNILKHGFLTLYSGKHDIENSRKLAWAIDSKFDNSTKLSRYAFPKQNTELAVLNGTKMPAVLVECGYMGGDLKYCMDNVDTIALAILNGIRSYYGFEGGLF